MTECRPCSIDELDSDITVTALYQFNNPSLTNVLLIVLIALLLTVMIVALVMVYHKQKEHFNVFHVWQQHNRAILFGSKSDDTTFQNRQIDTRQ